MAQRKVHIEARAVVGLARHGRFAYLGTSVCGRYDRKRDDDEHLRRRLTSAVTCRWCRARWTKHGQATPPKAKVAA